VSEYDIISLSLRHLIEYDILSLIYKVLLISFFFDATFTGDKDNFVHIICAQEERQPQASIDLTTLQ